jgi:metal transporter CNNM
MESTIALTWLGIAACVVQSGAFSGLNLALFGISALRLESEGAAGNHDARRLLELRRDSNFLLSTVLWGNVGTNVLLTLLTDSVLAGAGAFVFSTLVITFGGEIIPQAYFSRNALQMATLMRPFLRFWQFVLFPIAKPTALMLDAWLGREDFNYLSEKQLREMLKRHVASDATEISRVEGIGVLNFMALDDLSVIEEGEPIHPESVIELPVDDGRPVFPAYDRSAVDPFLQRIEASGKSWVIFVSSDDEPVLALDADGFLRSALLHPDDVSIDDYCHRPIVVHDTKTTLEAVLPELRVGRQHAGDDLIDHDVILVWGDERRIITGPDILGRLLRGIARPTN